MFYISTRTPKNDADWQELETKIERLVESARSLTSPRLALDQDRWMKDAKLLVDASLAASAAAKSRNVDALSALNDALYASCVTCHQHYRPNYGRRAVTATPPDGGDARTAALTAGGQPDLQGVWSFATLTPLERPAEFAGKAFVTEQEAKAWVRNTIERNNRDRRDGGADVDVGRAVNDYWFERGTGLAKLNGRIRTSLVIDPADGKLPALTREARARAASRAADIRDRPADGPENRSLQERCLAFNAGPPMLPGPYNNYVQILQTADHIIILNEMIHDARIVPFDGRSHSAPVIRKWTKHSKRPLTALPGPGRL